jgi:acyl-CoA reductase-like NAD-dependent aldehyde dehydrogenase
LTAPGEDARIVLLDTTKRLGVGRLRTISPVDGRLLVERPRVDEREVSAALAAARGAGRAWRRRSVAERVALVARGVDAFVARGPAIAEEITRQIGRPIAHSPGEVRGFEERARHMLAIAGDALADLVPEPKPGFRRFVRREPLGVVLVLAPWNYPFLTAVNAIVPALAAGNAVILKHSEQTPLAAERLGEAFAAAGLPRGVFQFLHCDHDAVARMIASPEIDFVAFTGSVEGGHAVQRAAAERFIATGLELGGKDPAYVRADAPFEHTVENVVDGAFFNAGQSCCGIERVYVQRALFDRFVEAFVAKVKEYRLGDPLDPSTTLGPMARARGADFVREQIAEAVAMGARPLIEPGAFPADAPGTPYLAPQVLVNVTHGMRVMSEESFGPVVGIMPVADDAEAVTRMNDSRYGLTASIWTSDPEAALALGDELETGTVFMNRCDYLDPALAWTGVKDSGRGVTLSRLGYEALTRPKSYHLRVQD